MHVDLKAVMNALGPSASLIFASWIFMGVLQQRYTGAYALYRSLIEGYRSGERSSVRDSNLKDQVLLYKHRCELMKTAMNIGLVAAILLIASLLSAALDVVLGNIGVLNWLGTGCAVLGLVLVAVAAGYAIRENSIIQRAIDSEVMDISELAEAVGQRTGAIRHPTRER